MGLLDYYLVINHIMIKGVILVLSLTVLTLSVSYGQFIVNRDICKD